MHDEMLGYVIVGWESGVAVRAGVRAVRAVWAGCCVAGAGAPLFALRGWGCLDSLYMMKCLELSWLYTALILLL